jgi:hypothetical protein
MARVKKTKSGDRRSAAKRSGAAKNVDEYLTGVPEPARTGSVRRIEVPFG